MKIESFLFHVICFWWLRVSFMNLSMCRAKTKRIFHRLLWYRRTIKCLSWNNKNFKPSTLSPFPEKQAGTTSQLWLSAGCISPHHTPSAHLSFHPVSLLSNWSEAALHALFHLQLTHLGLGGCTPFCWGEAMSSVAYVFLSIICFPEFGVCATYPAINF